MPKHCLRNPFALLLGAVSLLAQEPQVSPQEAAAEKQRDSVAIAMAGSIEKQKISVRRQRKIEVDDTENPAPTFFVTEALIKTPAIAADCDMLSQISVQSLVNRSAEANHVSPELVRAVMKQESGFRPCAVSVKGAMGLMQLMPETARDLGVSDPFDAEQNTFGGARLLRQLLTRYAGDLNRTLGAYNAGPASVDAAQGVPQYPETITYIDRIEQNLNLSAAP